MKKILLLILASVLLISCEDKNYQNVYNVSTVESCSAEVQSITKYKYDDYHSIVNVLVTTNESTPIMEKTLLYIYGGTVCAEDKLCRIATTYEANLIGDETVYSFRFILKGREKYNSLKFSSEFVCAEDDTFAVKTNCF